MRASLGVFGACVALASLPACGGTSAHDGASGTAASGSAPTWHQDVAPLVAAKCSGCHRPGGIAPFSMQAYEDAFPFADAMQLQTAKGAMPPFLAADTDTCVPRNTWKDDIRLSAAEKKLIADWAKAGAPEGDPKQAAALPTPPEFQLKDPDVALDIPSAVTIDGNRDQFWCYVIDTDLKADSWFDTLQVRAGNPKVVHHVLVYKDVNHQAASMHPVDGKYECFGGVGVSGASLITAWAPGSIPFKTPDKVAFQLKKGATLILQVHYHPTGAPEKDETTGVDLRLATGTPEYETAIQLIGNFNSPSAVGGLLPGPDDGNGIEFKIPAGATNHTETMRYTVSASDDQYVWSMGTHMHYVGRSMAVHLHRANAQNGDPVQECLIDTPSWNFNWQRGYQYDVPLEDVPIARRGDRYLLQCNYDNTMSNPFMARALKEQGLSAPRDVHLGETTLDEMCLGAFAIATKIKTPAP